MDGRVLIDVGGSPLNPTPSWQRFDNLDNCRCNGVDITTGRQSEFDVTEAGEATVYFHDRAQVLNDPDLVGSPILIQAQDPTTGTWHEQARMTIDDEIHDENPNAVISNTQLKCKDMFDYLARTEFVLGEFGQPDTGDGSVLYEDQRTNERVEDLLDDAQIPDALYTVFSLNTDVWDTWYDPGDSVLTAIRDALDAEFPSGVALAYIDRHGVFQAHGRFARFDPDTVAASASGWDFQRWAAGTRGAVGTGVAQVREFSWNRPRTRIYNAAFFWPRYNADGDPFPQADKTSLVRIDSTSRTRYGYSALPQGGDLILKSNINNDNDAATECGLYGDFFINNYSTANKNIQRVTLKSTRPEHRVSSETWALMLQSDISDIIALTIPEAGISAEDFYIEGFTKSFRPLNPEFDMVTVTPNLTPFSYYTDNVFEEGT